MADDRRFALVGLDLAVLNVVVAPLRWAAPPGLQAVPLGEEHGPVEPGDFYDPVGGAFLRSPTRLAEERARVAAEVQRRRDAAMRSGAPYLGKRIDVDDASRTNLGGVVTMALIALGGAAPWPESLKLGWIAMDNTRIPMGTPAQGIALGTGVLGWYSGLIQFGRDLKDAVSASTDPRSVAAAADWTPWEGPFPG